MTGADDRVFRHPEAAGRVARLSAATGFSDACRRGQRCGAGLRSQRRPTSRPSEDWIDALPSVDEACAGRVPVKADEVEKQASLWLKSLSEEDAADTRFISLAHLYSACTCPRSVLPSLARPSAFCFRPWRAALRRPGFETLGDASVLIAVRLEPERAHVRALGPSHRRRAAVRPPPAVPGDWLAARALSHPRRAGRRHRCRVRCADAMRRIADARRRVGAGVER